MAVSLSYPTLAEVDAADQEQICRWYRLLCSPGIDVIGTAEYETVLSRERIIMDRIAERFRKSGGFTPALSKKIGW